MNDERNYQMLEALLHTINELVIKFNTSLDKLDERNTDYDKQITHIKEVLHDLKTSFSNFQSYLQKVDLDKMKGDTTDLQYTLYGGKGIDGIITKLNNFQEMLHRVESQIVEEFDIHLSEIRTDIKTLESRMRTEEEGSKEVSVKNKLWKTLGTGLWAVLLIILTLIINKIFKGE